MIGLTSYVIALVASTIWFSLGFRYFAHSGDTAAKLLVGRDSRKSPLFKTIVAGLRFLGGFNGALAAFSTSLLVLALSRSVMFDAAAERALVLVFLGSVHLSQFVYNVPVLLNGGRHGEAYWPVTKGPMYMIFMVDLAEAVLHITAAILQFID